MPIDGAPQQEFNTGLAIVYQIDAIERELMRCCIDQENHQTKYNALLTYFKILLPHITKKEDRERQLSNWRRIRSNTMEIQRAIKNNEKLVPFKLLEEYDLWEMELREMKQKYNLGMQKFDPRFAMAGRGK